MRLFELKSSRIIPRAASWYSNKGIQIARRLARSHQASIVASDKRRLGWKWIRIVCKVIGNGV
jgi:hypothetical protein